jgi:4-hydroxybenzoyl-CoA thioesterase
MRTFVHPVLIGFGDCDPAGIVFYPNFFRWFDAAAHQMFRAVGCDIRSARAEHGWIVGPLVDAGAKFRSPATHGDLVEVHSQVGEFTRKTFRIDYRILRGDTLVAEGWEVRILAEPDPEKPGRIRALELPEAFRRLFD